MGAVALIPLREHGNEPRVFDLDLAERLEFENPYKIRDLIRRHKTALDRLGFLPVLEKKTGRPGRPAQEYWPNEKQAYFICAKSEAPKADDVTVMLVETFCAWRHGKLIPAAGQAQMDVRALQVYHETHVKPVLDAIINRLDGIEGRFGQPIEIVAKPNRIDPSAQVKRIGQHVIETKFSGLCPCCHERALFRNGRPTDLLEWHHVNGNARDSAFENILPLCVECHQNYHARRISNLTMGARHDGYMDAAGRLATQSPTRAIAIARTRAVQCPLF